MALPMVVRSFGRALLRAWFMFSFAMCVGTGSLVTRLCHLLVFLPKRKRQQLSAQMAGLAFRGIFKFNPHISVEHVGEDEPMWDQLFAEEGKSPFIIINHTSLLDSIFYSACVPVAHIANVKTLAKSSLFSTAVFGTIMRACGHFPVHFQRESTTNDFTVDRTAQERISDKVAAYVQSGGGLSLFPEGQINRGDTRTLQLFRRGAFESFARKHNMTLWAFIHTGVDKVWPPKESIGGYPAKIRFKLVRVPPPPAEVSLAGYVDHVQRCVQLELELLQALDEHEPKEEVEDRKQALKKEIDDAAHGSEGVASALATALDMGDVRGQQQPVAQQ